MSQYGYPFQGPSYGAGPYAPQMMPPAPPPPPPPMQHSPASDPFNLVPHSRRPQLYGQGPGLQRAQSQQLQGYGPAPIAPVPVSNNRWPPRQDAYLPSSPISYAPPACPQQSSYVGLDTPPAPPSHPYSHSAPQSYFSSPPPSVPPPIPPKSRRHSGRSARRPSLMEGDGFPAEKLSTGSRSSAPPLIRVLSQTGEEVELDEEQALALAIERSLTINHANRPIPPDHALDEEWNRRNSVETSDSSHGHQVESPAVERRPSLTTTPTTTSNGSSRLHRPSMESFQSSFYSPLSPHDRNSMFSFTSDTATTSATATARPDTQGETRATTTSLPSHIIVPGKPNVYQLVGDSVPNLLKQLIAQADVQLEASPAVFDQSTAEAPHFKLVCYIKGWKQHAESKPVTGYAEEPKKRRSSGSSVDERDTPFCTIINLQAEEVDKSKVRKHMTPTTTNGAPVGAWGDTIEDPSASIDERGLRIDFSETMILPLRLDMLVERLHAMLQAGKSELKRPSLNPTVESETAVALHKFVLAHPGQYNPEDLLRKINKSRMKEAPPPVGKDDASAPADEGGLLGQEKRLGKRFLARKVTSKVIGKLQGHRHDVEEDGREDWITPFMPTKEEEL